jgi:metal-sulfur cluster biosynthetic enzyme
MINETQVMDALRFVIDPEIGLNIVDLGLVYDVIIEEAMITVTMTLTTPGCPMHSSITSWVENQVKALDPGYEVFVNLVWEPQWTPDKMSDEAKQLLGQ